MFGRSLQRRKSFDETLRWSIQDAIRNILARADWKLSVLFCIWMSWRRILESFTARWIVFSDAESWLLREYGQSPVSKAESLYVESGFVRL